MMILNGYHNLAANTQHGTAPRGLKLQPVSAGAGLPEAGATKAVFDPRRYRSARTAQTVTKLRTSTSRRAPVVTQAGATFGANRVAWTGAVGQRTPPRVGFNQKRSFDPRVGFGPIKQQIPLNVPMLDPGMPANGIVPERLVPPGRSRGSSAPLVAAASVALVAKLLFF